MTRDINDVLGAAHWQGPGAVKADDIPVLLQEVRRLRDKEEQAGPRSRPARAESTNRALKTVRQWAAAVLTGSGTTVDEAVAAEAFHVLDLWISDGGALPEGWWTT